MAGPSISRIPKNYFFLAPSTCPIDLFGLLADGTVLKQLHGELVLLASVSYMPLASSNATLAEVPRGGAYAVNNMRQATWALVLACLFAEALAKCTPLRARSLAAAAGLRGGVEPEPVVNASAATPKKKKKSKKKKSKSKASAASAPAASAPAAPKKPAGRKLGAPPAAPITGRAAAAATAAPRENGREGALAAAATMAAPPAALSLIHI